MKKLLVTYRNPPISVMILGAMSVFVGACGSKPDPGPTPKPPWPDSPELPSNGNVGTTSPNGFASTKAPRNREAQVELIALADIWVLVKPEGKEEIWRNLRKDERLLVPKTGKMAITYSSGKSLRIESEGRVIKPSGGNELVGSIRLQ
ncbi:MAG: hypothetical protein CMI30_06080 [Opitutae bacterium]|nr:hypothetical protein [Opitutae bacterium]|tara:strand:- start:135 stop:578 length:444 start_codon:yes stop_codon:yes gene_type:complete